MTEYLWVVLASLGLSTHSTHMSMWRACCLVTFLDLKYPSLLVTLHLRLMISLEPWLMWTLVKECFAQLHFRLVYPRLGLSHHIGCLIEARLLLQFFRWVRERKPWLTGFSKYAIIHPFWEFTLLSVFSFIDFYVRFWEHYYQIFRLQYLPDIAWN